MAVQHGGAGLRIGHDSRVPGVPRYCPPAPFGGTVHQVRIEAPGTPRPTRRTRSAPPCTRTEGVPLGHQARLTGLRQAGRCSAPRHGPGARGCGAPQPVPGPPHRKTCPRPDRTAPTGPAARRRAGAAAPRARPRVRSSNAMVSAGPTDPASHRVVGVGPVDVRRGVGHGLARRSSPAASGRSVRALRRCGGGRRRPTTPHPARPRPTRPHGSSGRKRWRRRWPP